MSSKSFGMVSTRNSVDYTAIALKTFFEKTTLGPEDRFYLIDNDKSLCELARSYPTVEVVTNDTPKSFSANVNQIIERAAPTQSDLYFLNNDLVFTTDWLQPLLPTGPVILSPMSNREVQHEKNGIHFGRALELREYLGNENLIEEIATEHKTRSQGYIPVMMLPFFCVKIPHMVYSELGNLDESFGVGGAEDNDYCLRAALKGFRVAYARQSYVLHFSGRSTWGAETEEQRIERDTAFRVGFERKWGEELKKLCIDEDFSMLEIDPYISNAARGGKFDEVITRFQLRRTKAGAK